VNENLAVRFMNEVAGRPETKAFYGFQIAIENIHSEMYALLIDTYIRDPSGSAHLSSTPSTRSRASRRRATGRRSGFLTSVDLGDQGAAFACVEGSSSGSFCSIFLPGSASCPGLCFSNELPSAATRGVAHRVAVLMHRTLMPENKSTPARVVAIYQPWAEKEFVLSVLPCTGMNGGPRILWRIIEFVADRLLVQLGCATPAAR
jgi:ribonucleoside-diphosphate reductase beta chain